MLIKLRPILYGVLTGVLTLYTFSTFSDTSTLQKKNQNLMEQSRQLQEALTLVQKQHAVLLRGLENRDKDSQNLKDSLDAMQKENKAIQETLKKNEARVESIKEEKSYLEEMLINKTKQIEILKNQGGTSAESAVGTEVQPVAQNDEELSKLGEQNRVLQEKLDRLYKTTNAKMNEINIAKIALEETVSTAKKKIEDEWNTVNLGSVTTSAVADTPEAPASTGTSTPKAEGHVLAINSEHGFVVVDLGKVDILPSDAMLEVKKNGLTIATLSVLEIRDVMAACNIKDLQTGQRIEINDSVSILR